MTRVRAALHPDTLIRFARDGYVLVPEFFDAREVARLRAWTDALQAAPEQAGRQMVYGEASRRDGSRIIQRIENFCPFHAGFGALLSSGPLLDCVAALFSEPAVLFKDKINLKLPGGDGFQPHQDQQAGWSRYADIFITALVAIDDATEENGCLELVAGQHRRGLLSAEWQPLSAEETAGFRFEKIATRAGDALFFDSFVPHRSPPNLSDARRRLLYVTYNRAREGDHRRRYFAEKRQGFPPDIEREPGRVYVFRV